MLLKKNSAMAVNSFAGVHHKKCPIAYPSNAPETEPTRQIEANLKAFFGEPRTRAISNASGGIGKKDASANESINNAADP